MSDRTRRWPFRLSRFSWFDLGICYLSNLQSRLSCRATYTTVAQTRSQPVAIQHCPLTCGYVGRSRLAWDSRSHPSHLPSLGMAYSPILLFMVCGVQTDRQSDSQTDRGGDRDGDRIHYLR